MHANTLKGCVSAKGIYFWTQMKARPGVASNCNDATPPRPPPTDLPPQDLGTPLMYSHRELPFAGGEQINCYKILPKSRIRNPTAVVCVCV